MKIQYEKKYPQHAYITSMFSNNIHRVHPQNFFMNCNIHQEHMNRPLSNKKYRDSDVEKIKKKN